MPHVPHLYLPGPWVGTTLVPTADQVHHLRRVLRRRNGEAVSYTDGRGQTGSGTLSPEGVVRGREQPVVPPEPSVRVAAAPPRAAHRARFLVEKLAELGVDRLTWVRTRYSQARPPRSDKCKAWVAAALEQSGGGWLMEIRGPVTIEQLDGPVWVADPAGGPIPEVNDDVTLLIGPEGGLAPDEMTGAVRVTFGERLLRIETAAVVGAALLLGKRNHGKG